MKVRYTVNEMEPGCWVEIEDWEFLDRGDVENALFYAQEVAEEDFRNKLSIYIDNEQELKDYLKKLFKQNKKK